MDYFDVQRARSRDLVSWGQSRSFAAALVDNPWFARFVGCLIVVNIIIMAIDANDGAACVASGCADREDFRTTEILNLVLLVTFTIELSLRIYVDRWRCLLIPLDVIDGISLFLGYLDVILISVAPDFPNMQLLRACRALRMFRSGRFLYASPEFYMYLRGFGAAMRSMLWGVLVVFFVLIMFSIVSVELVNPRLVELFEQDHKCATIFATVQDAIVYYFKTSVAGDSWGECAVPLSKEYVWPFGVFAGAYIVVQLGLLNMILSVIVDSAATAREQDLQHKAAEAQRAKEESTDRLLKMVREIDKDNNGSITHDELLAGYDEDRSELRDVVSSLHISRDELGRLFQCLDEKQTGTLEYHEFVEQIQKAHSSDLRVQFMLLKMELHEVARKVQSQIDFSKNVCNRSNATVMDDQCDSPRLDEAYVRRSSCETASGRVSTLYDSSKPQPYEQVLQDMTPCTKQFEVDLDAQSAKSFDRFIETSRDSFMRALEVHLASLASSIASHRMMDTNSCLANSIASNIMMEEETSI